MAEESGPSKGSDAPKGKADPKRQKLIMIGIGVAALLVIYAMMKGKGSGSGGGTGATTSGGVTADVAVPSGDVTPTDLMAQFATTTQATQAQLLATIMNHQGTGMPGGPPPAVDGPNMIVNGKNLGAYDFGMQELQYLGSHIGQFGITQGEVNDVTKSYQSYEAAYGQTAANHVHFSWNSPGKVDAIPSMSQHDSWPSTWQTQPGISNAHVSAPSPIATAGSTTASPIVGSVKVVN